MSPSPTGMIASSHQRRTGRVDDDAVTGTAHGLGARDRLCEFGDDTTNHVRRRGQRAVVHQDVRGPPLRGKRGHRPVARDPRDVVDDVRPCLQRSHAHGRLPCVDADRQVREGITHGPEHRQDAMELLRRVDGHVTWTRRLPAQVQQLGTIRDHPLTAVEHGIHPDITQAVATE